MIQIFLVYVKHPLTPRSLKREDPPVRALISYKIPALKKSFIGLKAVSPNSKNPAENPSAGFFPSKYPIGSGV
jgi:hypothetical protein